MFKVGDRVRCRPEITDTERIYGRRRAHEAAYNITGSWCIPEGARGTVVEAGKLVGVEWDGDPDDHQRRYIAEEKLITHNGLDLMLDLLPGEA